MDRSLADYVPTGLLDLEDPQTGIPALARDEEAAERIEQAVRRVPTSHRLVRGDARDLTAVPSESVALVVTSPPYWSLKKYKRHEGQLGHIEDYETFLDELDKVWKECYRVLKPGGRACIVVGDVCLSRRDYGRHVVFPLHASIQERCRHIGFDNLSGIYWSKISNSTTEVEGSGRFLGKPYEPGAVLKNDVEFILMQRKPGGYRSPPLAARILSIIHETNFDQWFRQVWTDIPGEPTDSHPAPFPRTLAARLIRMFSFCGDTILDPFMGTGTTNIAAAEWGRDSIGLEVAPEYFKQSCRKLKQEEGQMFSPVEVKTHERRSARI